MKNTVLMLIKYPIKNDFLLYSLKKTNHQMETPKTIIYGYAVTEESSELAYSGAMNDWLHRSKTTKALYAIDYAAYCVGEGYHGSCIAKTKYVVLRAGEPNGLSYMHINEPTEEIKRDFLILGTRVQKDQQGRLVRTIPYCEIVVVDTSNYRVVWSNTNMEDALSVAKKYKWEKATPFTFT
jgi:hypothetical protein